MTLNQQRRIAQEELMHAMHMEPAALAGHKPSYFVFCVRLALWEMGAR